MKKYLAKIGRKITLLAFKYRLGKSRWSAKTLFFLMGLFENFGEYVNTNETDKEHHYVPQLILRRFRIADSGTDKGQAWEFSFENPKIEKTSINGVASAKDFYLFKDKDGKQSDFIEKKVFAENLEYFGNQVIKYLNTVSGEPKLTYLEESTLAVFVAFQLTRVPAFHSAIERYLIFCFENKGLIIDDLGTHESMNKKIVLNGLGATIDDLLKHKSNLKIAGAKNHIGSLSNQIATHIAEKIFRRNFHIIDVPATMDDRFVISDNPVVLLDFHRSEILQYPAWWDIDKDDLWIMMPISPTRAIFFCRSKRKGGIIENENTSLVQIVNFGQYLNATKSVFSNDKKYLNVHIQMFRKELLSLNKLRVGYFVEKLSD
ncbi:MAG: DUF4238 domain-containing protein [Patescibacteria group bacterium]